MFATNKDLIIKPYFFMYTCYNKLIYKISPILIYSNILILRNFHFQKDNYDKNIGEKQDPSKDGNEKIMLSKVLFY